MKTDFVIINSKSFCKTIFSTRFSFLDLKSKFAAGDGSELLCFVSIILFIFKYFCGSIFITFALNNVSLQ